MVIINYFFMCLIFGTTFLAIKIGVDAGVPPFLSAGLRFFIAGLLLFSFMVWREKTTIRLLFRKEMFFTGIGLTFGTFATLYWAEQYVTSGIAAVLSATGPMMIIVIQTFILKQKGSWKSFIGCVVGVIGVTLLILPSFSLDISPFWMVGCFAIILGEFFYASGTIYSKHVIRKFETTSPIALNAAQMMHGGILLIILSFFTENIQLDYLLSPASIGSLLYLTIFGSMIGHSIYYWLVSRTNPVFPSTWLYISPLIAVMLGVTFYHEYISWLTGIGTLTIIVGTVLVNFETLRKLLLRKGTVLHDAKN
ncbi:DMT family transporter [Lysinibacillus xylanilyticus]|uniref:EamA family transporter n=1 Tax=Lysinibacillus xylanilyticus TaxID=582475 RepID=A0A2M9Q994_9BACI|nr:EamA family transporter [Lysinibacillus xylanilyticus]PJO44634.1 EamA family transporter [Lysinibacillus xylanilyticus]